MKDAPALMNVGQIAQEMRERANLIESPDYVPAPDRGETPDIIAEEVKALDAAILLLEGYGY